MKVTIDRRPMFVHEGYYADDGWATNGHAAWRKGSPVPLQGAGRPVTLTEADQSLLRGWLAQECLPGCDLVVSYRFVPLLEGAVLSTADLGTVMPAIVARRGGEVTAFVMPWRDDPDGRGCPVKAEPGVPWTVGDWKPSARTFTN